jgi:hypothetical protein
VIGYNNRKEDYTSIKRYLQRIENNLQAQGIIYRNTKINDVLLKIQASCDNVYAKKKQILDAVQLKNSQFLNYVNTMEQDSRVLYRRLYEDIPRYVLKSKQMLFAECKNILIPRININDLHILGVNVYELLFGSVSYFVKNFNTAVESIPYYNNVCVYVRMPSLNIDNIFKGVRKFSYITSQSKKGFYSIPRRYVNKLKIKLAEHILFILSKNIDDEVNGFLANSKGIIDKNIEAFKKSSYVVPYGQIQNDMNNLRMQMGFFRSMMG